MRNKIIDNPYEPEIIQKFLKENLEEKRYLGKQQVNYVQRFNHEAQMYLNEGLLDIEPGRWDFEFFRSNANVLHHTDLIPGNSGELGFILPLRWEGHQPATIKYNWYTRRRVQYAGNNQIAYCDTDEIVDLDLDSLRETLVFEWDTEKAFIFDCEQLHSARKFVEGWKEFIVAFQVDSSVYKSVEVY